MLKTLSYFVLLVLLLSSCSDSTSNQHQTIAGKIQNNSEYKGGANPPQEILDALALYKPSANQTFYVRSATNYTPFTPFVTQFTTDADGNYSISLAVGSYAVIGQEKYNFEHHPLATPSCTYLQEPDFILTVTDNPPFYDSSFTDKVNYCLGYPL